MTQISEQTTPGVVPIAGGRHAGKRPAENSEASSSRPRHKRKGANPEAVILEAVDTETLRPHASCTLESGTRIKGLLFYNLNPQHLDANLSDIGQRYAVTTVTGNYAGIYTLLLLTDGTKHAWKKWPLVEIPNNIHYLSKLPPPNRSAERYAHHKSESSKQRPALTQALLQVHGEDYPWKQGLPVELDIIRAECPGIPTKVSISLLNGLAPPGKSRRQKGDQADADATRTATIIVEDNSNKRGKFMHRFYAISIILTVFHIDRVYLTNQSFPPFIHGVANVKEEFLLKKHEPLLKAIERIWTESIKAKAATNAENNRLAEEADAEERLDFTGRPSESSARYREEQDASAADESRRQEGGGFKEAVYRAACQKICHAFGSQQQSISSDQKLKRLFAQDPNNVGTNKLLEKINKVDFKGRIFNSHIIGESLELVLGHAMMQYDKVELRDYLAEEEAKLGQLQQEQEGSCQPMSIDFDQEDPDLANDEEEEGEEDMRLRFRTTKVHKVFISSSPIESPFYMTEEDEAELKTALKKQAAELKTALEKQAAELKTALKKQAAELNLKLEGAATKLAMHFIKHMKKDIAYDVLVWLKDIPDPEGTQNKPQLNHFIQAQCKGRADFNAHVDITKYLAHISETRQLCAPLRSLCPLMWAANMFTSHQLIKGNFTETFKSGKVIAWMFDMMCAEDKGIDLFARIADSVEHSVTSRQAKKVPPKPVKLEEHQDVCKMELHESRRKGLQSSKITCGVTSMATGGGKSYLAVEDMLVAEAENAKIGKLPSLWTAPGIQLILQDARSCLTWETARKGSSTSDVVPQQGKRVAKAIQMSRDVSGRVKGEPRPYYYVVCSAGQEASSTAVRVIPCTALLTTLLQHHDAGSLDRCRFFTTVEGSGLFWIQVIRYIHLTRGLDASLEDPVFGVFVRDEVHLQCGLNTDCNAQGLNIPAIWCPSYTATPSTEEGRVKEISKLLRRSVKMRHNAGSIVDEDDDGNAGGKQEGSGYTDGDTNAGNEGEGEEEEVNDNAYLEEVGNDDDDADEFSEEEGDPTENEEDEEQAAGPSGRVKALRDNPPETIGADRETLMFQGIDIGTVDPALAAAVENSGLHGLMLLSKSMQFRPLEVIHLDKSLQEAQQIEAKAVLQSFDECQDDTAALFYQLESKMDRSIAAFELVPIEERNDDGSIVSVADRFRPMFDKHKKTFSCIHMPSKDGQRCTASKDTLVLGLWHGPNKRPELCLQVDPPRGPAVHDCTAFGQTEGMNKVGAIATSYSFRQCFDANKLAKPGIVMMGWDPLLLPTDDAEGSKQGVLNALRRWSGVQSAPNEENAANEGGYVVEDPRKFFINISFNFDDGETENICCSAHEFRSMSLLLDLFSPKNKDVKPITKPIVFCRDNKSARCNTKLFKLLKKQRVEQLRKAGNQELADLYETIGAAHIYQSEKIDKDRTRNMEYYRRQQLLGNYLLAERFVLFNVNLLSTGIDLPCCDAVMLQCPSDNPITIIQRWGRSLRPGPDKRGLLILPCTSPYELDEEQDAQFKALGIKAGLISQNNAEQLNMQFDVMCRVAECCADTADLTVRRLFSVVTGAGWKKTGPGKGDASTGADSSKPFAQLLLEKRKGEILMVHMDDAGAELLCNMARAVNIKLGSMQEEVSNVFCDFLHA